jgi:hypothetical protein
MNIEDGDLRSLGVTRRWFVQVGLLVGALALLPKAAQALAGRSPAPAARDASTELPRATSRPVVSFHMDQPYVDYSGAAEPYVPPVGARAAEHIASLSDEMIATLRL